MNGLNWNLDDDLKTVTVSFPTDPPVQLKLDPEQIDEHIINLAKFRAHMLPEHPVDYALRQKVTPIRDPRWVTEPEAMAGDSLIHLRHPGFGWLHFLFPRYEAAKLADSLQTQAAARPALPPDKPH